MNQMKQRSGHYALRRFSFRKPKTHDPYLRKGQSAHNHDLLRLAVLRTWPILGEEGRALFRFDNLMNIGGDSQRPRRGGVIHVRAEQRLLRAIQCLMDECSVVSRKHA
jgi:hypothetical protein